jgi:hypothetical protein
VLDTVLGEGVPLAGYVGGGYDDDLEVDNDCPIMGGGRFGVGSGGWGLGGREGV